MGPGHWYELRVEGSADTVSGLAAGTKEGIAIAENGRLCPIASGEIVRRFESEQEASEYLLKTNLPGNYRFEVVLCSYRAAA